MFLRTFLFFNIFSLTHKKKEVWPDGTHPMLFTVKVVSACQSFTPIALLFFWQKYHFWLLFGNTKMVVAI